MIITVSIQIEVLERKNMSLLTLFVTTLVISLNLVVGQPEVSGYYMPSVDGDQLDLPSKHHLITPSLLAALTVGQKVSKNQHV